MVNNIILHYMAFVDLNQSLTDYTIQIKLVYTFNISLECIPDFPTHLGMVILH
jgi:hypothetical protein